MTGYLGTGYGAGLGAGYGAGGFGAKNCICSFPTLVVLILIVLQFSRYGKGHGYDGGSRGEPVGNGILFIIALFYLSCAGCGRAAAY